MTKILAAIVETDRKSDTKTSRKIGNLGHSPRQRPNLASDQCAYCKEHGHWAKDCPKKNNKPPPRTTNLLALEDDD